jgi:hypothetical protein
MKQILYYEMDYMEFDKLVNKHIPAFKGDYEFVACHEANNYAAYTFNVEMPKDDKSYLDIERKILLGEDRYTRYILMYLVKLGVLAPGNYLINVFW